MTIQNWGFLIFAHRNEIERDLDAFIRALCQTAGDKGMQITQHDPIKRYADANWGAEEITRRLRQEFMPAFGRQGKIELLIIVTPTKSSQAYVPVKRYCDTVAGIASQCVTKTNIRHKTRDKGFVFNMLMKINSKLGGVNVTLREMPLFLRSGTVYSCLWWDSKIRYSSAPMSPILLLAHPLLGQA